MGQAQVRLVHIAPEGHSAGTRQPAMHFLVVGSQAKLGGQPLVTVQSSGKSSQVPRLHTLPGEHAVPQRPQLATSTCVSLQVPAQSVSVPAQRDAVPPPVALPPPTAEPPPVEVPPPVVEPPPTAEPPPVEVPPPDALPPPFDAGVEHVPREHTWLPTHTSHALPPWPHAAPEVPGSQTSPRQQPMAQVVGPHAAGGGLQATPDTINARTATADRVAFMRAS